MLLFLLGSISLSLTPLSLPGAFVVVSHNRDFVTGLCGEEWRVSNGRVKVVKVSTDGDASAAGASGEARELGAGGSAGDEAAAAAASLVAEGAKLLGVNKGTGGGGNVHLVGSHFAGNQACFLPYF